MVRCAKCNRTLNDQICINKDCVDYYAIKGESTGREKVFELEEEEKPDYE